MGHNCPRWTLGQQACWLTVRPDHTWLVRHDVVQHEPVRAMIWRRFCSATRLVGWAKWLCCVPAWLGTLLNEASCEHMSCLQIILGHELRWPGFCHGHNSLWLGKFSGQDFRAITWVWPRDPLGIPSASTSSAWSNWVPNLFAIRLFTWSPTGSGTVQGPKHNPFNPVI